MAQEDYTEQEDYTQHLRYQKLRGISQGYKKKFFPICHLLLLTGWSMYLSRWFLPSPSWARDKCQQYTKNSLEMGKKTGEFFMSVNAQSKLGKNSGVCISSRPADSTSILLDGHDKEADYSSIWSNPSEQIWMCPFAQLNYFFKAASPYAVTSSNYLKVFS